MPQGIGGEQSRKMPVSTSLFHIHAHTCTHTPVVFIKNKTHNKEQSPQDLKNSYLSLKSVHIIGEVCFGGQAHAEPDTFCRVPSTDRMLQNPSLFPTCGNTAGETLSPSCCAP